jgi:hypothetical protein
MRQEAFFSSAEISFGRDRTTAESYASYSAQQDHLSEIAEPAALQPADIDAAGRVLRIPVVSVSAGLQSIREDRVDLSAIRVEDVDADKTGL